MYMPTNMATITIYQHTYKADDKLIIVLFPQLIDHVICCGFEAFHARKVCDLQVYFVDLSMVGLFDCWLPVILNPAEMCIRSSHP